MTSLRDGVRGLFRLCTLLRRESIDLIHTHLYGANLLGRIAGRLMDVRVVSSVHCPDYDPELLMDNPALSPAKLGLIRLLDQLSCRLADPEFIAVSEYARNSSIQHLRLAPDRVRVIHNPIDVAHFDPTRVKVGDLQAKLMLPREGPVILSVARYHPQKGLRYLIEGLSLLTRQHPTLTTIFIGGGPEPARRLHEELANQLGVAPRCRFLSIQADVRPYLKLCDVFVLPSLFEGFGIALVEAMAMERPCITTRVSALPEVVEDGRSGILVELANPSALAGAIDRLLKDPGLRCQMGTEGRKIVLEQFNVDRTIHQLEKFYESVTEKGVG